MMNTPYLPEVKKQYESLPYPERNPKDEATRLVQTFEDNLALVNHYCFAGKQTFKNNFRCLVAGGGTGDAAIFLAEQLRHTNSEIVYLDMSTASTKIAKERAKVRRLKNITWINKSLLLLPELNIGKFDYINCSGVLHHLENRNAGLRALKSVLKPNGAMAIMVYGKHARVPVYQMQELMRIINQDTDDTQDKINRTREVLSMLPDSNSFVRLESVLASDGTKIRIQGDPEIFDLFLHSQDVPLSVSDIYDWLDTCELKLLTFPAPLGGEHHYRPSSYLNRSALLDSIEQMPARHQHAISELICSRLITHTFYAAHHATAPADPNDLDNVPFLFAAQINLQAVAQHMRNNPTTPVKINHPLTTLTLQPGQYLATILLYLDGKRSLKEIFDFCRKDPHLSAPEATDAELLREFLTFYSECNRIDSMLLRHKSAWAAA